MDLNAIQDKLIRQVDTLNQGQTEVPVDWPRAKVPRPHHPQGAVSSTRLAELSTTVETLKQRSAQSYSPGAVGISGPTPGSQGHPGVAIDLGVYLRRLAAKVDEINQLSISQERAMNEIQAIQARLTSLPPHLRNEAGFPVNLPSIDFASAVTASAELDAQGNISLTYRTIRPVQPDREARHLAAHLRDAYGLRQHPRRFSLGDLGPVLAVLWQEPTKLMARGCRQLQGWLFPAGLTVTSNRTDQVPTSAWASGSMSWVDAVLWFGGGVIGRVALNLLLAAFPALWSVAVVAITAITAYSLYRATLAPKLEFGLAYRVFLTIGGLVVGGHI